VVEIASVLSRGYRVDVRLSSLRVSSSVSPPFRRAG
jgi:hypothetical protein